MTGVRLTMFGLLVVPSAFTTTSLVFSGSTISKRRPFVPFSSPARIVPQAVRRIGSHDVRPLLTIGKLEPSLRLMATTPISVGPCSLHPIT